MELEAYAAEHAIDVRFRHRIESLTQDPVTSHFALKLADRNLPARKVVVATGAGQHGKIPGFASRLRDTVQQMHSSEYKNPDSVKTGTVTVVGAGKSGAQIAKELATTRATTICFERLPKRFPQRFLGKDIFWWFIRAGVMDRRADGPGGAKAALGAVPLIGSRLPKLLTHGEVQRRARVVDAVGTTLRFADRTEMPVETVIWATGFVNDFRWIDPPDAVDSHGQAIHNGGVAAPDGVFFIGLPALKSKGSGFLGFVGRDAEHLAARIAAR